MFRISAFLLALSLSLAYPLRADDHPLVQALAVKPADYASLSNQQLAQYIDVLWTWSYMGPSAPVKGTPDEQNKALSKARELAKLLLKREPNNPQNYARLSMVDYDMGERMPRGSKKALMELYEEMIATSKQCIQVDKRYADCWHWLATGTGRLSTTRGVLNSLFAAKEVEQAWLQAVSIQPTTKLPNGDRTDTNARYGLTVFYRMVPDSWLIKMITGTRGNKKKAVEYIRKAAETQPYRLEVQKELGAALLCYGLEHDDKAAVAEGKRVLQAVVDGKFDVEDIRLTDPIDKRHSAEMIAKPDLACAYSRDGYQDLDESKIKQ